MPKKLARGVSRQLYELIGLQTLLKTQLEYTEKVIADLKAKILKNEKAIKKSQPEDSMECCYLLSALKGTVLISQEKSVSIA